MALPPRVVSSRRSVERELFVSNVMLSDISPALKAHLGSIVAKPDMWLRLMLGGPLHEMGVEYTEAIAVLASRRLECENTQARALRLAVRARRCTTARR